MAPDAPRYFVNGNGAPGYFNDGLTRALDAVTPGELAAGLSRLLEAEESPALPGGKAIEASKPAAGRDERPRQAKERRAVPGHDGARAPPRAR